MSKDAFYFSHDSNARNDQRLVKLRMKYGMEGYGIYFGIIEILREQSDYTLSFDDLESIAFDLRVDIKTVEDIVSNYELFIVEGMSMFYSSSLKRRMVALDERRQKLSKAGRKGGLSKASSESKRGSGSKVNKVNKVKENTIVIRDNNFKNDVDQFKNDYDPELLDDFYRYWSEPNKSGTKMKFELQQTFDISRRLITWNKNDFGTNNTNGSSNFKLDTSGFPMAYCDKCGIAESYRFEDLKGDSKCCQGKLLSEKPVVKI